MSEDRAIPPTKRRRQEARSQGMIPKSDLLTTSAVFLSMVLCLRFWGGSLSEKLVDLVRTPLVLPDLITVRGNTHTQQFLATTQPILLLILAILVVSGSVGILIHQIQVLGFFMPTRAIPTFERLKPKLNQENGKDWLWSGLAAILRFALLGSVTWFSIRTGLNQLLSVGLDSSSITPAISSAVQSMLLRTGLVMFGIGLIDFALQHRKIAAALRMTPEELRDEQRELGGTGNPGRRRLETQPKASSILRVTEAVESEAISSS